MKKNRIANDYICADVPALACVLIALAASFCASIIGTTAPRTACAQSASYEANVSKPILEHWGIEVPPPAGIPDGVSTAPADYWMDRGYKLKESARKKSSGSLPLEIKITDQAIKSFYFALHHDPTSTKIALTIARAQSELGKLYVTSGDPQNAFGNLRQSLTLYNKISELSASQAELTAVKDETASLDQYLRKFVAAAKQASARRREPKLTRGIPSEKQQDTTPAKSESESTKSYKTTNPPEPAKKPKEISNPRTRIWATELLGAFRDDDRKKAAKELGKGGDPDAVEPLAKALCTDRDQHVRKESAKSLGKLAYAKAVPALGEALLDQYHNDDAVRKEVAKSLGRIGEPDAIDALVKALRNDISKHVRAEAADSLGLIGSRKAERYLRNALSDTSGTVRDHASKALKKIGGYR